MKKLRMFVTLVSVLSVVGGAFAFNAKKAASYCYSTTGTTICKSSFNPSQKEVTSGGTAFHYFSGWNGDVTLCYGLANCTSDVRLTHD